MSIPNDQQVTSSSHPLLQITQRNHVESPLLRLPGELRNKIFGYLLGGKTWTMESARPLAFADLHDALRISRVCRQIYAEDPTYTAFVKSSFAIDHRGAFKKWLKARSVRYVEAITSIIWVCHGVAIQLQERQWQRIQVVHDTFSYRESPHLDILPGLKSIRVFGMVTMYRNQSIPSPDSGLHDQIQRWIECTCYPISNRGPAIELSHAYRVITEHNRRKWYELV